MSLRTFSAISIFSAIATIISYFDFATPFFPSFLKLDFADLPALIISFSFGPLAGVLVQLVRNLLHLFVTSTAGVGEFCNFLVGSSFVATSGFVYRKFHTKKGAIFSLIAGGIVMTIVAVPVNYFIILPLFSNFLPLEQIILIASKLIPFVKDTFTFLTYVIIPFNIIKAFLVSILTFIIYKKMHPIINKFK